MTQSDQTGPNPMRVSDGRLAFLARRTTPQGAMARELLEARATIARLEAERDGYRKACDDGRRMVAEEIARRLELTGDEFRKAPVQPAMVQAYNRAARIARRIGEGR